MRLITIISLMLIFVAVKGQDSLYDSRLWKPPLIKKYIVGNDTNPVITQENGPWGWLTYSNANFELSTIHNPRVNNKIDFFNNGIQTIIELDSSGNLRKIENRIKDGKLYYSFEFYSNGNVKTYQEFNLDMRLNAFDTATRKTRIDKYQRPPELDSLSQWLTPPPDIEQEYYISQNGFILNYSPEGKCTSKITFKDWEIISKEYY